MRNFVEANTRLTAPKLPPAVIVTSENGLPVASNAAGVANGSAMNGGQGKENTIEDLVGLSRMCYRHVMQYEYCRAVSHNNVSSATPITQSSIDLALPAVAVNTGIAGENSDNGEGSSEEGVNGFRRSEVVAPPAIELPPQPMLCLDRALLEVECGLHVPAASASSTGSAESSTLFSPSPVLFYFPKPPRSELPKSSKKDKRKTTSVDTDEMQVKQEATLVLKPCEFKDMVFKKYKTDTLRKQG